MIQATVERMYTETEENRFLEVTYANGDKEVLYFKDFNSGAMIQNIVDRAKKMAIKDFLEQRPARHPGPAPAAGVRGRVQGERGPPEHHQPRRLGPHLRQEGRADRLHPHAHHRQGGHRDRAARSTRCPTPASTSEARPPANAPTTGRPRQHRSGLAIAGPGRSLGRSVVELARVAAVGRPWPSAALRRHPAATSALQRLERDREHPLDRGSRVDAELAACGPTALATQRSVRPRSTPPAGTGSAAERSTATPA